MKRTHNYAAALATTAAVALLTGTAHAQGVPACTTTMESPVTNNCVLPTASAPGGGSFPGSFLVPGTNTSFAVHGWIWFDAAHNFGPHEPQSTSGIGAPLTTTAPLEGPGASAANRAAHALNGGTNFDSAHSRINFETRTPTAYGLLKTFLEFDFNQTSTVQQAGNADLVRLRHAYGTLGPWLIGQTWILIADPQTFPDYGEAGGADAGGQAQIRTPQIRYTYLAGNGLSITADVEQATSKTAATYTAAGAPTAVAIDNIGASGSTTINQIPDAGVAAEWDQPWGHLRFAGIFHESNVDNTGVAVANAGTRNQRPGYGFQLSGHLNTIGRDVLRASTNYTFDYQLPNFNFIPEDRLYGIGVPNHDIRVWAVDASYEHFFTGQWRANAGGGYVKAMPGSGNSFGGNQTAAFLTPSYSWSTHANVIYSPVPAVDLFAEYIHVSEHTIGGGRSRSDQLSFVSRFYF